MIHQCGILFQINILVNSFTCIHNDTITDFLQQYQISYHHIQNIYCCFSRLFYITVSFFPQQTDFRVLPIRFYMKQTVYFVLSLFAFDYALPNDTYYKHIVRSKAMFKINIMKAIKITLGCCLAFITANALHLEYSTSVVTITLLSILNTKRDTLIVAWKRSVAFLLASSIAIISFTIFRFSVWGLGIYLIIIVILCQAFELTDGLSMSTVLMLHIWTARSITASSLLNEATLMAIGILMGILMNLYMPNQIKKIKAYQAIIDRHFKELLLCFSDSIVLLNRSQSIQYQFDVLSPIFQKSIQATDLHINNHLFSDMPP